LALKQECDEKAAKASDPSIKQQYAMFSIMDFLPTIAHIVGSKTPTDRRLTA